MLSTFRENIAYNTLPYNFTRMLLLLTASLVIAAVVL